MVLTSRRQDLSEQLNEKEFLKQLRLQKEAQFQSFLKDKIKKGLQEQREVEQRQKSIKNVEKDIRRQELKEYNINVKVKKREKLITDLYLLDKLNQDIKYFFKTIWLYSLCVG